MKRWLCLLLVCAALCGCTKQDTKFDRSIFCMDTVMDIQVWGVDATLIAENLITALQDLDSQWNANSDTSVIAALNRGDALTPEQQTLIDRVESLAQRTGGAFDPRLYAVTEAWGFPTDEFRIPTQQELDAALAQQLWDLGAAIKGYAADRCVELLQQTAATRAMLDLGGNIQTYGEKPDGSPWKIGIRSPRNSGTVGTVCVNGTMSIVTSGDYQRYFEQDGKRYCHIFDPETGCPADSGLASVTVVCESGLTADVLSTALFVMGLEEGSEFWRESTDFEAIFITAEGEIFATEGVELIDCQYEVILREK